MSTKKNEVSRRVDADEQQRTRALAELPSEIRTLAKHRYAEIRAHGRSGKALCYLIGKDYLEITEDPEYNKPGMAVSANFSLAVGIHVQTLNKAARIVQWKTREDVEKSPLSWSHFEELVEVDERKRDDVMKRAEKQGLSVRELRSLINKKKITGPKPTPKPLGWNGVLSNVDSHRTELSARFTAFADQVVAPLLSSPPDAKVASTVRRTREGLEELDREIRAKIEELKKIEHDQAEKARQAVAANQEVLKAAGENGQPKKDSDPHPAGEANGTLKNRIGDAPRRQRPAGATA